MLMTVSALLLMHELRLIQLVQLLGLQSGNISGWGIADLLQLGSCFFEAVRQLCSLNVNLNAC